MFKRLSSILMALIITLMFSGCSAFTKRAGQSVSAQSNTVSSVSLGGSSSQGAAAASASSKTENTAPKTGKAVVKMMLPASKNSFGALMSQVANAQNVDLQLRVGADEPRYTLELTETLLGEDPPDIYWLPGEFAARVLEAGGGAPYNLAVNHTAAALQALGNMVPQEMRLLGGETVIGLPVGLYAKGTLVNLPLLAGLLGSEDLTAVREDLTFCSYEEWMVMQTALADYLQKPGKYQFTLAENTYTTPSYRPDATKTLRGLWALPTVGAGAYAKNALDAIFASAFVDPADYLDSDPEMTLAFLQNGLEALYDALEFETLHMVSATGESLTRGENWQETGEVTENQARNLFAEGKALFWKGDTKAGLQLEKEKPETAGNLALIPIKLPFQEKEVAVLNTLQATGIEGYLCIANQASANAAPGEMLVRLFTDANFLRVIESELYLLPYTSYYPTQPILAGLEEAVGLGDYYQLPLSQNALVAVQKHIDDWMNTGLMGKEEWTEEDKAAFLTAVQGMIGTFVETGSGETSNAE